MSLVITLAGLLVLGLLAVDVFLTVFHPYARGGPWNKLQNRLVWGAFRRIGCGGSGAGARAERLLGLAGPLLAILSIVTWAAFLITGFALLYFPRIDGLRYDPAQAASPWVDAFYYSGYVATTVGLGDLVPSTPGLRLLTVLEGAAGLMLITVAIAYVLSVYGERRHTVALASSIGHYLGDLEDLHEGGLRESRAAIEGWTTDVAHGLAHAAHAHGQYPILYYYRSESPSDSLPVQVGRLIELLDRWRTASGDPDLPQPLAALGRSVEQYLDAVAWFIPRGETRTSDISRMHDRHADLLRHLCYKAWNRSATPPGSRSRSGTRSPGQRERKKG